MGRDFRRLLHLSDLHLTGSGFDEDGVDARGSLERMLDDLRHVPDLDAVLVSGDLADDGSGAGYEAVAELIGGFARERGIGWVVSTGNHDDRVAFAQVLGSGHHDAAGRDNGRLADAATSRAAVSDVGGVRVVTLDSLVPGRAYGDLPDEQLAWLRTVLAQPAGIATVLVMHHPPISPPGYPMREIVLRDPRRLAAVLAGSDVRAVLTGHLHHQMSASLAGVPVWVTPGVVTRIDVTAPERLLRGVLGASASLVDICADGVVFRVLQARDPRAGEQVYLVDACTWADVREEEAPSAPR